MADDEILDRLRAADARIAAARRERGLGAPAAPAGLDFGALLASIPERTPEDVERERLEDEERERQARAADAARKRRYRLEQMASVPLRDEVKAAIADQRIAATNATRAADAWAASRRERRGKPTLVLLGGAGCGKTTAAALLMSRYDRAASYVKMRGLADLYRAGFGADAERFARLLSSGLLVVDELTTERDIELGRAALHEVIDERQARDLPTVLIGNCTKQALRERYDARTIDRLREGAVVVELADKSLRRGQW